MKGSVDMGYTYAGMHLYMMTSDKILFKECVSDVVDCDLTGDISDTSVSIFANNYHLSTNAPRIYQMVVSDDIEHLISEIKNRDDYCNITIAHNNVNYEYFISLIEHDYLIRTRKVTKEEKDVANQMCFEDPIEFYLPKYKEKTTSKNKTSDIVDEIINLLIDVEQS